MEQLRAEFLQDRFDASSQCHQFGYHPSKWEALGRTQQPVESIMLRLVFSNLSNGWLL